MKKHSTHQATHDDYIEIRLPKFAGMSNIFKQTALTPLLVVALFVAAFFLGTLTEKLHLFMK